MQETTVTTRCDGCAKEVDPNVQPRVIIYDSNETGRKDFCDYACLAQWATGRHDAFTQIRAHHMDVTIQQTNETLALAHKAEYGIIDLEDPPNYRKVADVPLHPLVELVDGDPPTVRLKVPA